MTYPPPTPYGTPTGDMQGVESEHTTVCAETSQTPASGHTASVGPAPVESTPAIPGLGMLAQSGHHSHPATSSQGPYTTRTLPSPRSLNLLPSGDSPTSTHNGTHTSPRMPEQQAGQTPCPSCSRVHARRPAIESTPRFTGPHALQDAQMHLMLLEQQAKNARRRANLMANRRTAPTHAAPPGLPESIEAGQSFGEQLRLSEQLQAKLSLSTDREIPRPASGNESLLPISTYPTAAMQDFMTDLEVLVRRLRSLNRQTEPGSAPSTAENAMPDQASSEPVQPAPAAATPPIDHGAANSHHAQNAAMLLILGLVRERFQQMLGEVRLPTRSFSLNNRLLGIQGQYLLQPASGSRHGAVPRRTIHHPPMGTSGRPHSITAGIARRDFLRQRRAIRGPTYARHMASQDLSAMLNDDYDSDDSLSDV